MMRTKKWKLLVTFPTTTAAMQMEKAAKLAALPGRLIPVPALISAGCGLAFCTGTEYKAAVLRLLGQEGISFEGLHEVLL